jgi:hypothetical protein
MLNPDSETQLKGKIMKLLLLALALLPSLALAEHARYGEVDLNGLARESWNYNPQGVYSAMVCNVNGNDGFLSVRSGPGTGYGIKRNLRRLAILEVDTSYRQGRWIYVRTAYRRHSVYGERLAEVQDLHVEGWAHDSYICNFAD